MRNKNKINFRQSCHFSIKVVESFAYKRVRRNLRDQHHSANFLIKNVTHRVLPTDSVIVDSLLGQGEALDCFNLKLQDASVLEAELDNDVTQQKLDIITAITDPAEKASLYKKVFSECCDVPQSGCNCPPTNSNPA